MNQTGRGLLKALGSIGDAIRAIDGITAGDDFASASVLAISQDLRFTARKVARQAVLHGAPEAAVAKVTEMGK